MKNLKIFIVIFLFSALLLSCVSCTEGGEREDALKVVCTVFPYYDFAKNIMGDIDGAELSLLVKDGADLHSYNATARDIIEISSADIIIMTGGESDAWVEDVLREAQRKDILVVRLLDKLEADGLALEADPDEHEHDEECEHIFDEHIWLSPKMAQRIVEYITEALVSSDGANAEKYRTNATAYGEELAALDKDFSESLNDDKPLVFADRFPFSYLARDYSLECVAAFSGCSADSEASFATVMELSMVINEHSLNKIFVTESSSGDIARSVIGASKKTDCKTLVIDSMQSINESDIKNGANYIEIMRSNLASLKG